ncbi:NRT1/ PTR family protein 4.6 [Tanacetum coccineum]
MVAVRACVSLNVHIIPVVRTWLRGGDAIVWEGGYVDWKKKPAKKGQHGGMRAALFVLVVEVMENLAYLVNASNLVLYLTENMHFSLSKAANNVTDFMGTAFLLALLGGFLSDAFFTAYQIYIFSASLECLPSIVPRHVPFLFSLRVDLFDGNFGKAFLTAGAVDARTKPSVIMSGSVFSPSNSNLTLASTPDISSLTTVALSRLIVITTTCVPGMRAYKNLWYLPAFILSVIKMRLIASVKLQLRIENHLVRYWPFCLFLKLFFEVGLSLFLMVFHGKDAFSPTVTESRQLPLVKKVYTLVFLPDVEYLHWIFDVLCLLKVVFLNAVLRLIVFVFEDFADETIRTCDVKLAPILPIFKHALLSAAGLVILTIQARSSWLQPPECKKESCEQVHGGEAAMLFLGLYLVALGVGGIKGSLPVHGAEQFDENDIKGRKQRSTFFNYFVFCLAIGALIAVTFVVWMEDNKGWVWGFGISMLTIFLSIPVFLAGSCFYRNKLPCGSPLTTIFKVVVASMLNNCVVRSPSNASIKPQQEEETTKPTAQTPSLSLKFLNRAAINKPACKFLQCSVLQVEDVKVVLKVLPIFGCTIMLNCCLAQLSTFSVQQAATMNTKIGNLKVPPASLPVFPVVFIILLAPIYDHIIVPFARKTTKSEMGISHLQRIGIGLLLSIVAMAIAALVEIKRKRVATKAGLDTHDPLSITFLWIAFQYLFLGSADLFTLAGLLEFFFTEAPVSMGSLATSLPFASLAMGYYLSSVIVSIVNSATGEKGWLSGTNLSHYRLERFYWVMCALSALNFLHYLFGLIDTSTGVQF